MSQEKLEEALGLHQAEQFDQAEEAYLNILVDEPKNAEVLKLLGVLACQRSQFEDGISYLEASIEADPSVSEYHHVLGHSYLVTGRIDDAITSFIKAGEIDPGREDVFAALGDTYQNIQKFPEALKAYHQAAEIAPDQIKYHVNAGLSAIFSNQFEIAGKYLNYALERTQDFSQVYYGLALVEAEKKQIANAHEFIKIAVKLDPDNPEYQRLQQQFSAQ